MYKILALGDCNTQGDVEFRNNSFVERFANMVGLETKNCGYTMSTTREMRFFYEEYYHDDLKIVLIQYGLVDSWKTFKYSPYVLYYPNNFVRKIARKFTKKYKKIARKLGLNKIIGEKPVVSLDEYRKNLKEIIKKSKNQKIFLIETVPNKELFRNKQIKRYNAILNELSMEHVNCYIIDIYEVFEKNFESYYLDNTHINDIGYNIMAKKLFEVYINC